MPLAEAFDDEPDVPNEALMVLTNLGVKTCGELADRLLANNTFGLKLIEVQALCESIETMSSDDEKPVKFNEVTEEEPAFITCPACNSNAMLVDGGEYGCSKDGCGWLGTPELAETHCKNLATKEAAKPKDEPLTPEELAAYDAETVRLVNEAEAIAKSAEYAYENSKAVASEDKKRFEAKLADLRGLIHERSENRGKRPKPPEPTLLDVLPKWKSLPLSTLEISPDLAERIAKHASDLGGLDEIINSDGEPWEASDSEHFGLTLDEVADLRAKLKAVIEKDVAAPAPESDLYKQYPIDRWERFGLTKKDIEKLHACETKGTATGFPIITIGDLQRFITPNAASPGYVQSLKDIKGIGDAGCDRIEEAQMQFWGWWRSGGEAEFAAEMAGNAAARE